MNNNRPSLDHPVTLAVAAVGWRKGTLLVFVPSSGAGECQC